MLGGVTRAAGRRTVKLKHCAAVVLVDRKDVEPAKAVCEEDADRDEEDMEAVEVVDVEVIWEDDSTNAETATDADVEAAEKPDQDGHEEVLRSLSEIRKVCAKILSDA